MTWWAEVNRKICAWLLLITAIVLSWLIGAVFVRVGLDWSDTFPYSAASEWRYLGVAILAITAAVLGTSASVIIFRKALRRMSQAPKTQP